MLSATLLTKSLKTVEESALSFSNYIICLNKISLSTTLGDIKLYTIYSFMLIQKDIPIRNLKRNTKADGSSIIFSDFFTSQKLRPVYTRWAKKMDPSLIFWYLKTEINGTNMFLKLQSLSECFETFWCFTKIFFISNKHGMYELPHELPKDLRMVLMAELRKTTPEVGGQFMAITSSFRLTLRRPLARTLRRHCSTCAVTFFGQI